MPSKKKKNFLSLDFQASLTHYCIYICDMRLIEVTNPQLAKAFIQVNPDLLREDPLYIQPLNKDIEIIFDSSKNKYLKEGKAIRWLLQDDSGKYIGRIAACVHPKYKNKNDEQPTGCMGFFDCINNQEAANLLFDQAKIWLQQQGMEAMDGPINFGERDRWWGLLLDSKSPPLFGMNYHPAYYKTLFDNYGFEVFFYQSCYYRPVQGRLDDRFYEAHAKLEKRGGFSARMVKKDELDNFVQDFVTVYNSAWASHEGNKEMTLETAKKLFKSLKPVMDEKIAWFTYYKNEPIAMYINIPDLNEIFGRFNGKFGLIEKLRFLWFKNVAGFSKMVGIIFGVVPRFHGFGVDYYMIVEAAKVIQGETKYEETELQWQGDFNPKIINISKHLGFEHSRELATMRYLFDRNKPFKRHPIFV